MTTYTSISLSNVTCMAPGADTWNRYSNDLWHWVKHASGYLSRGVMRTPEIRGISSETRYVELAAQICRGAVSGASGTEVKVRERNVVDGVARIQYLVWFEAPGMRSGLFLVVTDCGDHGELETMFAPIEGKSYFDEQPGSWIV